MATINYFVFSVIFLFAGLSPENSETALLMLIGYFGIVTHYVKKWSEKVEREEEFKIKKSVPSIILSFITTSILIILRSELESFIVFTKFVAFMVGYFGNSWFFGFIENKFQNLNPPKNENNF
jgi:hypothetical protein